MSAKVLVEQQKERPGRTRLLGMIQCVCVCVCVCVCARKRWLSEEGKCEES